MRRIVLVLTLAVAVAALMAGCGGAGQASERSEAAGAYWATSKALARLDYDVQDVLLHARLRTPGELSAQLDELAGRGAEQSRAIAPYRLPESFDWRRDALRAALDAQVATLRRTARAARAEGPDAARRAGARLLAQSDAISTRSGRYWILLQAGP
jgi:hypothetical protein